MKLGALHIYIVILSYFLILTSIIKLFEGGGDVWIIALLLGAIINCVYVSLGVGYVWRLEYE